MRHSLAILDRTGHTVKEWTDEASPELIAEIESIFATKVRNEHYLAYTTDENGGNATVVTSFDQAKDAPKIILTPQLVGG